MRLLPFLTVALGVCYTANAFFDKNGMSTTHICSHVITRILCSVETPDVSRKDNDQGRPLSNKDMQITKSFAYVTSYVPSKAPM